MISDHLPQDADSRGSAAVSGNETGDVPHAPCYIPGSPLLEVMQEQVDYLMSHLMTHAGNHPSPVCPDCARLEEVRQCLLKPFV